jgi:hypothetical protein
MSKNNVFFFFCKSLTRPFIFIFSYIVYRMHIKSIEILNSNDYSDVQCINIVNIILLRTSVVRLQYYTHESRGANVNASSNPTSYYYNIFTYIRNTRASNRMKYTYIQSFENSEDKYYNIVNIIYVMW